MYFSTLISLAAGLASQVVSAACSSALKIDDFSKYSQNTNSLNDWTSDDATMTSISASSGVLSFKPKSGSYFYETFACQAASTNGYTSLQFSIKGPAGGSFTLELQSQTACSATTYSSEYVDVTGLTGNTQIITVALSQFSGANAKAVTGFVWSGFSSTTAIWQLSNIAFGCGGSSGISSSAPSSSVVRSSSVARFSLATVSSSVIASSITRTSLVAASSSTVLSGSVASSSTMASSSSPVTSSAVRSSSAASNSASSSGSTTSNSIASSTIRSSSVSASTLMTVASATPSSGICSTLLIDDWTSQSRLTFLLYNAMNYPSSDDGSSTSITVGKPSANHVQIVPKADGSSYFYSEFPCVNAKNKYGGISLRIKAPAGTTISVELDSSDTCDSTVPKAVVLTESQLGWTFDGTEKLYLIPFSKFSGLNTEKLVTILFSGFTKTVSFGPMAFYCGTTGEYIVPSTPIDSGSTATVAAPTNTAAALLVVDKFANANTNALGNYHGGDDGLSLKYSGGKVTIAANDSDYSFYTQVSASCSDFSSYKGSYVHIAYSGSDAFTVAFQQHNSACNPNIQPYPETWDSAEAARYANNGHIYIPMNHFNIDFTRVVGFALKGFYTTTPTVLSVIEIVSSVPVGTVIPQKDETGDLVFACKRPNSFAFAIDDGDPTMAQEVLKVIREADIKVTFFTVGQPLLDTSTNLTNVYKEMQAAGHQLAMHSFTHPKMEGLPDYAAIDWEYNNDISAMKQSFNGFTTTYFRPPFGTEGARMRSRLTKAVGNQATITEWSVDVEDWLWAETNTPEQQKVAFQRDVDAGGNLVVLHYLYPTTVSYLQDFITMAKATGKQLMRVDQCMMDPNAPPL